MRSAGYWKSIASILVLLLAQSMGRAAPVGQAVLTDASIAVTLLRPCYRDCIFPGETVDALEFQIRLSPDTRTRIQRVVCVLVGEDGAKRGETTVQADDIGAAATIPIPELAVGRYTLSVAAQDNAGNTIAASEKTVRRLAPPASGNVVRIDENRNILVDGNPFLGIGWYGRVPLEDPRADVVALQNLNTPAVIYPPDSSPIRKSFEKHGIRTIVSVESLRLFYAFSMWQKQNEHLKSITKEQHTEEAPSDLMRETVAKLIECVRGEPGLLGYYISDEPEIQNIRSKFLENYYLLLRELDPYHPVFVTNDTVGGLVSHGYRCCDIFSPDPYSSSFEFVPLFLRKINEIARPGQAWMVTPWHSTTRTHSKGPFTSAGPYPYRVFRNQYFSSLCYGARGFTGYTSAFFMPEIEYRYGLPFVWREIRFLEPYLSAPPLDVQPEVRQGSQLAVRGMIHDGHAVLMVVNHSEESIDAEIAWEHLMGRTLVVLSEGREIGIADGVLRERLESGDVQVYTDAPGATGLPHSEAIETELARRHREAIKPGNLLHYDLGASVTSTKGAYAPGWVHQYYYYALNGIVDDNGWYLSHCDAKSATLEITLKQSTSIGRVEFYTPNIRDYTIDCVSPSGAVTSFSYAGNRAEHVVHGFEPAVDCLKLRFTVEGVQNSETVKGSILREIEAYTERGEAPVTGNSVLIPAPKLEGSILFGAPTDPLFLWTEDFREFKPAPKYYWNAKDTTWVLDTANYDAVSLPDGGVRARSISPQGDAHMTHFIPCDPAHRFLQVCLDGVEGEGYQFTWIHLGDGSGKTKCRGGVNTSRPGSYTVDTHYVHDGFRTGAWRKALLTVGSAGTGKNADGTVKPGPEFTYRWIRLGSRPIDGLAVTLSEGEPLPGLLKYGDTLRFEVHLLKPALDVVVEAMRDATYDPIHINGKGSIQLVRAKDSGRVWAGTVTLEEGTDRFKGSSHPVVFRAAITGGAIAETYASAAIGIE